MHARAGERGGSVGLDVVRSFLDRSPWRSHLDRLSRGWERRRPRTRVGLATLVVVVVVVVVGLGVGLVGSVRGAGAGPDGSERSIGQTVSGFFQAQRDGDCARLIDLVTEEAWSDGGRRGRRGFLEQCAAALEGYDPGVVRIDVEHEPEGEDALDDDPLDGDARGDAEEPDDTGGRDRATVGPVLPAVVANGIEVGTQDAGPVGEPPPDGRLVREGGEWKVEPGLGALRIGRSVEETIQAYVDAYNEGDCERLVDLVSEAVWSSGGERTRAGFVEGCAADAAARDSRPWQLPLRISTVDGVDVDLDDDQAEARVELQAPDTFYASRQLAPDEVALVREGLTWKLDPGRRDGASEADPQRPLPAAELIDIHALLLGEVARPGGTCFEARDDLAFGDDGTLAGDQLAVRRELGGNCEPVSIEVRRLVDEEAARAGAGSPFPGLAGTSGFGAACAPDCTATAVRHGYQAAVTLRYGGDVAEAQQILRAQLERL
jgi:hypothetical protein